MNLKNKKAITSRDLQKLKNDLSSEISLEIKKIELKMIQQQIPKLNNPFLQNPNHISFSTSPVNSKQNHILQNKSLKKEFEDFQNQSQYSKKNKNKSNSRSQNTGSRYLEVLRSLGKCASESYFSGIPHETQISRVRKGRIGDHSLVSDENVRTFHSQFSPRTPDIRLLKEENKSLQRSRQIESRYRPRKTHLSYRTRHNGSLYQRKHFDSLRKNNKSFNGVCHQKNLKNRKFQSIKRDKAKIKEGFHKMTNVGIVKEIEKKSELKKTNKLSNVFKKKRSRKENQVKSLNKKKPKMRKSLKTNNLKKKKLKKSSFKGASKKILIQTLKELGVLKNSGFDYTINFKSKKVNYLKYKNIILSENN